MATKSFQQEVAEELAGKAVMWGPAVAGEFAFGPLGALAGAITSLVIVTSGSSSPSGGKRKFFWKISTNQRLSSNEKGSGRRERDRLGETRDNR